MQYLSPFPGFSKTRILGRREEELRHALRHDATPGKITKAADRVRVAKLHLIKALQSALTERKLTDTSVDNQLANLQQDAARWHQISCDEIVESYKDEHN